MLNCASQKFLENDKKYREIFGNLLSKEVTQIKFLQSAENHLFTYFQRILFTF